MFINVYDIYIHIHTHNTRLSRVVDETTRGYRLGAKRLVGKWYWGTKRLRVKNRGETTRRRGRGGGGVRRERLGGETPCYHDGHMMLKIIMRGSNIIVCSSTILMFSGYIIMCSSNLNMFSTSVCAVITVLCAVVTLLCSVVALLCHYENAPIQIY